MTEQIQIAKFDEKIEGKVFRALKKLFDVSEYPINDVDVLSMEKVFLIDPASVYLVEAKIDEAKICLSKFDMRS